MSAAVRERLHAQVVAAIAGGLSRLAAYHHVAERQAVRVGVVATAYHRVERERAEASEPHHTTGELL